MKTKQISRRYENSWIKQPNIDEFYCDICKHQLFQAPHGGIYCDTHECGKGYVFFNSKKN